MPQTREILSQEQRAEYITAAAREAGYEEGFGVRDCDLSQSSWWAVYTRQTLAGAYLSSVTSQPL